jgi:HAD superfamily hydrolase (TIGR01459 family)|tara:strand:+ start:115 stop:1002 length:888 start_codon:yes stop_codon:yes gene_type:complete
MNGKVKKWLILLYFVYFSISIKTGAFKLKKLNHLAEIYNSYDTFIIDLWGVVHNGVKLNLKAIEAIENLIKNKKKVVFLTNAPRPCSIVKQYLLNLGMRKDLLKNIMSSGEASMKAIEKEKFGKLFFHLGPNKDNEIFVNIKKNKSTLDQCEFILCTGLIEGKEENLEYHKHLLKNHVSKKLICTNPDLIVHRGEVAEYCAGTIAKLFESIGGESIYFGKPYKEIYTMCFTEKEKTIAIGDNLNTDIKGANNMNIDSIFISNGVHRGEFQDEKELNSILLKYKVEASYFQPQLIW